MRLNDLMSDGKYLPTALRDFHKQKDIFKRIQKIVDNRKAEHQEDSYMYKDLPNWVAAHIYVIDFFLWYMAKHGYTLQKSRLRCDFFDLEEDLHESFMEDIGSIKNANQ